MDNNLEDYFNRRIIFSKDKTKVWLGQPELIKRIKKKFGRIVKNMKKYGTSGTPGMSVSRIFGDEITLSSEEQSLYHLGVGLLLYLVKHSRLNIANGIKELSKMIDKASQTGMKEL